MGFNLQGLLQLKSLLTPENLGFLDRMLNGLTDPNTPGYQEFWHWFKSGFRDPEAYAKAYRALRQLVTTLKDSSK